MCRHLAHPAARPPNHPRIQFVWQAIVALGGCFSLAASPSAPSTSSLHSPIPTPNPPASRPATIPTNPRPAAEPGPALREISVLPRDIALYGPRSEQHLLVLATF